MGGDDSQKLLPWRGMILLSGAQTSGSLRIQHCSGKLGGGELAAHLPRPKPAAVVAQLQTTWVTFGKQTWVTSPARRSPNQHQASAAQRRPHQELSLACRSHSCAGACVLCDVLYAQRGPKGYRQ